MKRIWTIGHSTREPQELLALLAEHGVELVADVRTFPGSRRYPWFGAETMRVWLAGGGVRYAHFRDLGGRRAAQAGVPPERNAAWRNASFRNYADWMASDAFAAALADLEHAARAARVAAMCSEAVWWRCHRSLIADALVLRGFEVRHILAPGAAPLHELGGAGRPLARLDGGAVAYPAPGA